jgi:hypothetical protein
LKYAVGLIIEYVNDRCDVDCIGGDDDVDVSLVRFWCDDVVGGGGGGGDVIESF